MADNIIELVAKLNEEESIEEIKRNLNNTIIPALNKPVALKIKCAIDESAIEGLRQQLEKIGNTVNIGANMGAVPINVPVKVDTEQVQKSVIGAISVKYPPIQVTAQMSEDEFLKSAKEQISSFLKSEGIDAQVTRIKRAAAEATGEVKEFYVQLERGDKSTEELSYGLDKVAKQYKYLGEVIREADNSTDFRTKSIDTQWAIQTERLSKFISDATKAGFASNELKEDIEKLNVAIAQKGDANAMKAYLDQLDISKAKYQALSAEVRKDSAFETHNNRIQKLSASLNDYAAKNTKATQSNKTMSDGITTFAEKWAELNRRLQQSDLSASEFKHLNEEVATFKKEADAAGLSSSSLFRDMRTQLTAVIAQWISLQGAIRIVRSLVDEVKTLDTAMVELRKVTEATDEQFSAFQKSAANTAKTYGASISDVIDATSTFSRLGEALPDAEELGKVAVLFKNVGDGISIDAAASDLVSIMKAFNIEASDSIEILDKLNSVGNNFAISSGGIGEALKRSSSALASANNDLSESIALITTAKMYWLIVQKCA